MAYYIYFGRKKIKRIKTKNKKLLGANPNMTYITEGNNTIYPKKYLRVVQVKEEVFICPTGRKKSGG